MKKKIAVCLIVFLMAAILSPVDYAKAAPPVPADISIPELVVSVAKDGLTDPIGFPVQDASLPTGFTYRMILQSFSPGAQAGTMIVSGVLRAFDAVTGNLASEAVFSTPASLTGVGGPIPVAMLPTGEQIVLAQATCQILRLVLGPLDLNLLGLRIQLNRVVLNITAQQGPGNLLGNLLCAVANLLNPGGGALPPGVGTALQGLLNQINALLNALLGAI